MGVTIPLILRVWAVGMRSRSPYLLGTRGMDTGMLMESKHAAWVLLVLFSWYPMWELGWEGRTYSIIRC